MLPGLLLSTLAFAGAASPLGEATQLLLVTTPSWSATGGTAQRYERRGPSSPWRPAGGPLPVVVGSGGLGWRSDAGAPPPPEAGPIKHEGDGRAPAGVLHLGGMWGYDGAAPAGVKLPYHAAAEADRCVDDPAAAEYGRLVRAPAGAAPWRSAEVMRRGDDLYRHLLVVTYNMERPVPGAGSCIFLHLWRDARSPTAGCTAMAADSLLLLARWLDPARRPVIVQLPANLAARLRGAWQLP